MALELNSYAAFILICMSLIGQPRKQNNYFLNAFASMKQKIVDEYLVFDQLKLKALLYLKQFFVGPTSIFTYVQ